MRHLFFGRSQCPHESVFCLLENGGPVPSVRPVTVAIKVVSGPHGELSRDEVNRLLTRLQPGHSIRVGRSCEDADVHVPLDPSMSKAHFEVAYDGQSCTVKDLDSRNGTFVNGTAVKEATLHHGDSLVAGETTFEVGMFDSGRAKAPPAPTAAEDGHLDGRAEPPPPDEPVAAVEAEQVARGSEVILVLTITSGPFDDAELNKLSRLLAWIHCGQKMVIGRSAQEAEMVVRPDGQMSPAHFEVSCDGRSARLRDLGSDNGTFVNDRRVEEAVLQQDDKIRAGETIFAVGIWGASTVATSR